MYASYLPSPVMSLAVRASSAGTNSSTIRHLWALRADGLCPGVPLMGAWMPGTPGVPVLGLGLGLTTSLTSPRLCATSRATSVTAASSSARSERCACLVLSDKIREMTDLCASRNAIPDACISPASSAAHSALTSVPARRNTGTNNAWCRARGNGKGAIGEFANPEPSRDPPCPPYAPRPFPSYSAFGFAFSSRPP